MSEQNNLIYYRFIKDCSVGKRAFKIDHIGWSSNLNYLKDAPDDAYELISKEKYNEFFALMREKDKGILEYWPRFLVDEDRYKRDHYKRDFIYYLNLSYWNCNEAACIFTGYLPNSSCEDNSFPNYEPNFIRTRNLYKQLYHVEKTGKLGESSPLDYYRYINNLKGKHRLSRMDGLYPSNVICNECKRKRPMYQFPHFVTEGKINRIKRSPGSKEDGFVVILDCIECVMEAEGLIEVSVVEQKIDKKHNLVRRKWSPEQKKLARIERIDFEGSSWKTNFKESRYRLYAVGIEKLDDFKKCYESAKKDIERYGKIK